MKKSDKVNFIPFSPFFSYFKKNIFPNFYTHSITMGLENTNNEKKLKINSHLSKMSIALTHVLTDAGNYIH